MSENFHVNFRFPGPVIFKKKIFKGLSLYKHLKKWFFLLWPHTNTDVHDFYKGLFFLYHNIFLHVNFSFSGRAILEKEYLKKKKPVPI
jgi:hypothetical protein